MVFQDYALYPHMSVYDNMAFALKLRKTKRSEIDRRVREAAKVLGIDDYLRRKPKALSGGQRQRVAMGRAIVREPMAFLMDEPLSNLDAKLRVQMRAEIARIQSSLGVTTIYVTHDQTEAMTMGHRVAVLRRGYLQQVDVPQALYDWPINLFVAGFIGSPAMNMVIATLEREDGRLFASFGTTRLGVDPIVEEQRPAIARYVGRSVALGIRPESIEDATLAEAPADRRFLARIELRESLGSDVLVHFPVDAPPVLTEEIQDLAEDRGEVEELVHASTSSFVARLDPRTRARPGETIEVMVDTSRLHVFDLDTGNAITG
jgi:multiple sugar transport system ATP-binding protein